MNNSRGSTLAIAASAVFLFAMLGVGAINFGGAKRLFWATAEANTKAFWLADAGIENALVSLQNGTYTCGSIPLNTTYNIGAGSYQYTSTSGTIPCTVNVTGTVGTFPRSLQAKIENFTDLNHNSAAVYSGSTDHSGAVSSGSGSTALANGLTQDTTLTAQDVFGTPLADVEALATKTYSNGQTIPDPLIVSGITVIKTTTSLTLNDVESSSGAVLIIDTTGASSPEAVQFITIGSSATFNGIIYTLGNLYIAKGPIANGAVYVQGDLTFHDSGGGNGGVIFGNSADITSAGSLLGNNLFLYSWIECKNTACT